MKLELKHIAPYLPYAPYIKILNYKCDYVGIQQARANGYYMIGDDFFVTYDGGSTGKGINDFKIALWPLTEFERDITKRIRRDQLSNYFWECYDMDGGIVDAVLSCPLQRLRTAVIRTLRYFWPYPGRAGY